MSEFFNADYLEELAFTITCLLAFGSFIAGLAKLFRNTSVGIVLRNLAITITAMAAYLAVITPLILLSPTTDRQQQMFGLFAGGALAYTIAVDALAVSSMVAWTVAVPFGAGCMMGAIAVMQKYNL